MRHIGIHQAAVEADQTRAHQTMTFSHKSSTTMAAMHTKKRETYGYSSAHRLKVSILYVRNARPEQADEQYSCRTHVAVASWNRTHVHPRAFWLYKCCACGTPDTLTGRTGAVLVLSQVMPVHGSSQRDMCSTSRSAADVCSGPTLRITAYSWPVLPSKQLPVVLGAAEREEAAEVSLLLHNPTAICILQPHLRL
eukprot:GHUV01023787.1.p1 GENE.GHUV01023787.1~~GHUV01023787.1.p1  ORF type:complete len:195 (-),score=33.46 GHUV01023787.1:298-882(-)